MTLNQLVALGAPLQTFENKVAVIKGGQKIAAPHSVASPNWGHSNESVERSNGRTLYFGFKH